MHYNKNNDIVLYLIGTNVKNAKHQVKEDAKTFASFYNMHYIEVDCITTTICDDIVERAITDVCRKMDEKVYPYDPS